MLTIIAPQTHDPETAVALALSMAEQPSSLQSLPDAHTAHDRLRFKMVVVVRADLGMSAGKIAAQCVHAALAAYRKSMLQSTPWVRAWENQGEATVCLQCNSDDELQVLQRARGTTCVTNLGGGSHSLTRVLCRRLLLQQGCMMSWSQTSVMLEERKLHLERELWRHLGQHRLLQSTASPEL
jgi:hypothetical protein